MCYNKTQAVKRCRLRRKGEDKLYTLESAKAIITRLANGISDALRVEVAVFNNDATLFFSTPTYLKKKGNAVHAPSISEVLGCGNVVVNKPGSMPSCKGCRFIDNCPSTVEILSRIRVADSSVGVVSITSFSKEGHDRICKHTEFYQEAVAELAALIGDIVFSKCDTSPAFAQDNCLIELLEISNHPLLICDANGSIKHCNSSADRVLSFCELSFASLRYIFSEDVTEKLLKGTAFIKKEILLSNLKANLTSKPIYLEDKLTHIIIKLTDVVALPQTREGYMKKIIGTDPQTKKIHFYVEKLANSPSPVLITGETGTGKELLARTIHEQSKRSKGPFIAINCSSIPEALFESELFGYEEGSFTGAKKGGKPGKFELANGGTLFLDELGDLPVSMQPKLLRVLQEYVVERVGSTEKIPLDIRIIAATNKNLADMMLQEKFRSDLFYRISVINIELPPLRERHCDIMPIAYDYLNRIKEKIDTPATGFDAEVEQLFLSHRWSGNIRELQNVVEYAANLCEKEIITKDDLPRLFFSVEQQTKQKTIKKTFGENEQQQLVLLLNEYGYTLEGKNKIAQKLGISLRTLYRKLEKLEKNVG